MRSQSGPETISPQQRYRRAVADVVERRGHVCEACGSSASHVHHINSASETGIDSELLVDPANMLLLCDDCHCLMHPGTRNRNMYLRFGSAASARGRALVR